MTCRKHLRTLAPVAASALLLCTPPPSEQTPNDTIPVENEAIHVAPVKGGEILAECDGWPREPAAQAALLANVDQIHTGLLDEFRRCQKYGLYTVVDTLNSPTVEVALRLVSQSRKGDTLVLGIKASISHLSSGNSFTRNLQARGVAQPEGDGPAAGYHWLGKALADLRRTFPCREFVANFYSPSVKPVP